jgi:Putative peptidoglycan binding domain
MLKSFYVNRVLGLVSLVILSISSIFASPSSTKKTSKQPVAASKHSTKSNAASLAARRRSTAPGKSTPRLRAATDHSSSVRTAHGRAGRGKKYRGRYAARSAPSFQTHPDEDRYRQIQQALADKGYFKGEVNGQWGQDSVEALQKFQLDNKFPDIYSDGKINALSLNGLGLGPKHGEHIGEAVPTPPVPAPPETLAPAASSSSPDVPVPQPN